MTMIIGVRFREVGKVYYFAPRDIEFHTGDRVIVETSVGVECGSVVLANRDVNSDTIVKPLTEVMRKATAADLDTLEDNTQKEREALILCRKKVAEHKMDGMKLIATEYSFDRSKLIVFFTSDTRVDFRELVRDLASVFHARIEMRQVGVRDETKIVGGIGTCGRPLCCHSWLRDFVPVTIKMAKEQNLSLNPQKISGVCGKLMCCLKNEVDVYKYLNAKLPKRGDTAHTADGRDGMVYDVAILRQKIKVIFTDEQGNRELEEFAAQELTYTARKKGTPHGERIKGDIYSIKNVEKKDKNNNTAPVSDEAEKEPKKQKPKSKLPNTQKTQPNQQKEEQSRKPRKPFYKRKKSKKPTGTGDNG